MFGSLKNDLPTVPSNPNPFAYIAAEPRLSKTLLLAYLAALYNYLVAFGNFENTYGLAKSSNKLPAVSPVPSPDKIYSPIDL
nr:MAG TPA: hypothetical protein [Caudoviricetes sp.]